MSSPQPPLLLALDVDGTLLVPRQPIRPAVVAAVKRAIDAGVTTLIVTGRMYVGAKPLVETLGITGSIICYQGAVIADAAAGHFEVEVALANETALKMYAIAKEHGLHMQWYRDDRFYVENDNKYAQLYAKTSGTEPVVVPSLPEAFAGRDSTKVNIVTDIERAEAVYQLMHEHFHAEAYVTRSNPEFIEMMNPKVDKGVALRTIAKNLGIPMERVMAVGDSYNDLPLVEAAGFGVAMGSAPDVLKAAAKAVVADVEHDGVAEAIDRFVLATV